MHHPGALKMGIFGVYFLVLVFFWISQNFSDRVHYGQLTDTKFVDHLRELVTGKLQSVLKSKIFEGHAVVSSLVAMVKKNM